MADAKSFAVSMRIVPAWPMGMHANLTRLQYRRRAVNKGRYLSVFATYFSSEVPAKADLYEDERAVLPVEGVDVGVGVGWHSSCVYDVGGGFCSCRH
jgi:hypothetical protein